MRNYVNLGIAAALRGLLVPNIKDAQNLSLRELARALEKPTLTAREGKTSPADQQGGTITITNIGVFGMDAGTPIINPGESGIVAMGTIRQKPWVVDGEVRPRYVTTVSGLFDHRVIDGDGMSRFIADVASILEGRRCCSTDRASIAARGRLRDNGGMLSVFVAALAALIPITNPIGAVAAYAGLLGASRRRRSAAAGLAHRDLCRGHPGRVRRARHAHPAAVRYFARRTADRRSARGDAFRIRHRRAARRRRRMTAPDAVHAATKTDISSPMALPLIAGPGAIGVVIGIAARNTGVLDRVAIVAAVVVIAAVIAVLLRYGTPLVLRLGPAGVDAITRVMGFLILAIGVELLVHGLAAAFPALA